MGGLTSDRKFFLINTSDHSTTETYYFSADEKKINLKLFQKRKEKIRYKLWKGVSILNTKHIKRANKTTNTESVLLIRLLCQILRKPLIAEANILDCT